MPTPTPPNLHEIGTVNFLRQVASKLSNQHPNVPAIGVGAAGQPRDVAHAPAPSVAGWRTGNWPLLDADRALAHVA
jgi:hypothetical protein